MNIRPSAAIRQNYNEIADLCRKTAEPVYLTKNGEGDLVVMSIDQFEYLNGSVEAALDAADRQAATTDVRFTHDQVFGSIRKGLRHEREAAALSASLSAAVLGRPQRGGVLYRRCVGDPFGSGAPS